ncbi:YihY/virulence factor BrkB family protein [Mycoplasmopsis anatis]|uniref:YihY/virulence factor BrkB family protein n=2 Tax=Mycoplasmopsis anatis TaxID=171279 RepID=F9QDM8_9BACT|nr:YihY/virulence factor BrkB family protein [Mycoplasmopsis anatis]EGS29155.1 hypothetical protein GIG_00265 [Mycoplasmopsis anatis 1340]VEU73461.1 Ribonuclease BN-like family [Mycoplasmopsis anatis]
MKLLKKFSKKNSIYKKYLKNNCDFTKSLFREVKKEKFNHNIIWPPRFKINIYEIICKFIIKIILFITMFRTMHRNKQKRETIINRTFLKFSSKEFQFIPISSCFYFLLSFVPIVIIVYFILSIFSWHIQFNKYFYEEILSNLIPGILSVIDFLPSSFDSYLSYIPLAVLSLSCLWLSSAGYGKMITSYNYIYGHKYLGTFLGNRIKGLLIVLLISLYISIWVIILKLLNSLFITFNDDLEYKKWESFVLFQISSLVFLYIGFIFLYKFVPSFKLKVSQVYSGSLLATIPIWILVLIFGSLNTTFKYEKYGPLGIFLYISVFISFYSYFIYLGIIVNESYYKIFVSQRTLQKKAIWKF